jgi:histidine ammonia-lyase
LTVELDGDSLDIESVVRVAEGGERVATSSASLARMTRFRSLLEKRIEAGEVIYGVNTGFGSLSDKVIPPDEVKALQLNLIRSHAIGMGDPLPEEFVRAAMVIRLNGLLRGNSAARPAVAESVVGLLNAGVTPFVPRYGSLGASGDLAPSAHMTLTALGEGKAYYKGSLTYSADALKRARLSPLELAAKEGLAMINGTAFTTAMACFACLRGELLLRSANASAALAAEVLNACAESFDPRLMAMRKFEGQKSVARDIMSMLEGSPRIRTKPVPQDPYSLRCVPQVHGSTLSALGFARRLVEEELNSVTDNPIFAEDGSAVHGGNFHAQPIAMALDLLSVAVSYLGVISLARTHLLLSGGGGAHRFLTSEPGLQSGLMVAEYTASALVAENAKEAHPLSDFPASVSGGIEDHASYGVNSGLKAVRVVENTARILAIELTCGSNGARSVGDDLSPYAALVCAFVRKHSPPLEEDRSLSAEIEGLASALQSGQLPRPESAE